MQLLLSGNEAIARGAREAGVRVAAGYPGTPSTEILEAIGHFPEVRAQWSPNEKVALEVGLGAAVSGARTLVTMKHVGLNVAADPLFTAVYTGIHAGLVLVVADDPGMHSSQNEQDSRHYARAAKAPILEPSDSMEALAFTKAAFEISERFDTPVLLRSTTRVSHSRSPVNPGDLVEPPARTFERDPRKYVMVPANARNRRLNLEERIEQLTRFGAGTDLNRIEMRDPAIGILTSGISYQYAREALPDASICKLGMTFPFPTEMVRDFAAKVERLYVVEELEPYLEENVLAADIPLARRRLFPTYGELDPAIVAKAFAAIGESEAEVIPEAGPPPGLPNRPPVMCPGCPHRAVFHTLRDMGAVVFGDIGCYTLGTAPPLSAMDSCICMGAGIGMALGAEKAGLKGPVVAVIGDSTFVHSGITPLIDIVYNGGSCTVLILDNRTTAMTGRQDHPATGRTLSGDTAPKLDLEGLCRSIGVEDVRVTDPYDLSHLRRTIEGALAHDGPSVVIARRGCALIDRKSWKKGLTVDAENCLACGICVDIGCPGLYPSTEAMGAPRIDPVLCTGCEECASVCPAGVIVWADDGLGVG